jgi:hypothetical protein
MFMPASALLPTHDPNEFNRLKAGRPATRVEILGRRTREPHATDVTVSPAGSAHADSDGSGHSGQRHRSAPHPVVAIRRGISRALITVGERIEPEAAEHRSTRNTTVTRQEAATRTQWGLPALCPWPSLLPVGRSGSRHVSVITLRAESREKASRSGRPRWKPMRWIVPGTALTCCGRACVPTLIDLYDWVSGWRFAIRSWTSEEDAPALDKRLGRA